MALLSVLVLAGLTPRSALAQSGPPQTQNRPKVPVISLKQNSPNPMNPETKIPFALACTDDLSRRYSVSLTIYNTLSEEVAIPVLQGGTGDVAGGQQLRKLLLPCGEYTAYWNGKYRNTQQEVASGVYVYILQVDGQRLSKKMLVQK